jgi:drug/metabolite transporter (DMT)-like permease
VPALLAGATCIGFAPILVRSSELGPVATALYRLLLALPVLWLWMHAQQRGSQPIARPRTRADFVLLVVAGACFGCDLAVWHWSIKLTSVANATLLANFAPVFVAFGAWWMFAEKLRASFVLALVLGIGGAMVLLADSVTWDAAHATGDALGLLTAVFYSGYLLAVSRLRRAFSTATIMAWSGLVTTLVLLPIAWISEDALLPASMNGWLVLFALAWLSHTTGQGLITYALAHLTPAFSSIGLLLQPVIAALLAWWFLHEPLHGWQMAGGTMVLGAIWLARYAASESQAVPPRNR